MKSLRKAALRALQQPLAFRRVFLSYQGTDNECAVRHEQATLLFGVNFLFTFMGVSSATLLTLAFARNMKPSIIVVYTLIIVVYGVLLGCGLYWKRRHDDAAFIRASVLVLATLGVVWGILVNLFAMHAGPDQQGALIGMITGLVSTPMLGVPVAAGLAFYLPISLLCTVAIFTQAMPNAAEFSQRAAEFSFLGFLAFALIGLLNMNKTILERSIGRLNLKKEHETIRVFLREYEEVSSDWLWETDGDGIFCNASARMAMALQMTQMRIECLSVYDFLARGAHEDASSNNLGVFFRQRSAFRDATVAVTIGDKERWLNLTGHPVYDQTGAFRGFRGIGSDVTDARIDQKKIEFLARHDGLTGLINRKAFVDTIDNACNPRTGDRFALLLIDLDNFKGINDDLGHLAGDDVLRAVAARLLSTIRPGDIAARIGGDEFAVLLTGVAQDDALDIAGRITSALSCHLLIENLAITPGASIGIALYPAHGSDTEILIKRADLALYRAKDRGKDIACLFEFVFEQEYLGRIRLQAELESAMDQGQIFLDYQPIVDVRSGQTVSVEALVRWRHPVRGVLSANVFIPSTEAGEFMARLGEYVLRLACHAAAGWKSQVPVAVNLSPRQLRSGRFISILKSCLHDSGLDSSRLSLEVTETVFLSSSERIVSQLNAIRDMRIRIILDDFGTGYSSLTYLRGFDVDGIKIDASFIRDLPGSQKVAAIVRTIARLAFDMNIYVVAEGVETEAQMAWLRGNGIPFAQGYLMGKPGADTVFSGNALPPQDLQPVLAIADPVALS